MKATIGFIFLTLFLISCNQQEDGSVVGSEVSHDGIWDSPCGPNENNLYYSHVLVIDEVNNVSTLEVNAFSDDTCETLVGTFELNSVIESRVGNQYNLIVQDSSDSYTFTPKSASYAFFINSMNFCGFNDWGLDVSKSILGVSCQGAELVEAGPDSVTITRVQDTLTFDRYSEREYYLRNN